MTKVGVIGAGIMGCGVAQNLAQSGLEVVLLDVSEKILQESRERITNDLRFRSLFNSSEILEASDSIMQRIHFGTDYSLLRDVDFVVENATENWEVKREIYTIIDDVCKEECIFMINTSCISITKLAALTKRADKVIGTHFMNPVAVKRAVEVIKGYHTSNSCIHAVEKFMRRINKEIIIVNDYPGFVSNRISHLFINEAAFVVQDQVALPEDVDAIFRKCYGHAMGPLETGDLIGLDTVVHSLNILYESYQDSKFRCCPLLKKMVDAGLYGRKSGQGFYVYP
ncbi:MULTISPECIES: 3-hydroxyacyl-CoA dehydrogenase family protein [Paenibacillus]|uniref:3-hydroxybutyryl-CoA dehydrogenase n=1 Tax=Paenibacillus cucumis (ex Kampfer et al. 2016) TaxID=1776858 RepID=A0ABS7KSH9_9BACL|nr:3-hydroxyacyl-CoA dehydrogenase NAD-binding domain-containing protein [Paenibacillus cucumis (ex Kampfer et al. 2016)]MBY0207127.1 3-hydroxybutyryl-CoA dehydrogenase [Paenibacillus cucumis (ex Kampfer et al. 2016)]MDP9698972.1 3-hydroxybutyryl-CoA dehydrogenase [Paenibacillus intestini]